MSVCKYDTTVSKSLHLRPWKKQICDIFTWKTANNFFSLTQLIIAALVQWQHF